MSRRSRSQAGGFTLIELMVGSAVMLVVLAGAVMVLLGASRQHRRQLEAADMERISELLMGQMVAELRQVGLGVPKGSNPEAAGGRFPATVLKATATDVVFMADLARPNSSFNGLSRLSDEQVAIGGSGLSVLNELNGTCDVDNGVAHCSTDQESALFPAPDTSCATSAAARTCPWSLLKYQPGEWIVMANGAGEWLERRIAGGLSGFSGTRRFLALTVPRPPTFFATAPNRGFAATPDRVFYQLNAGAVERKQCWGQIGGTLTVAALTTPCAAGPDGTGWEVRARDVTSLTFEYRDAADAVIPTPVVTGDLRRIRRVVIQLALARTLGDTLVTATATASATVRL